MNRKQFFEIGKIFGTSLVMLLSVSACNELVNPNFAGQRAEVDDTALGSNYDGGDRGLVGLEDAYTHWEEPRGTKFLQCSSYNFPPQNPNFDPSKHRWPSVGGFRPRSRGPYECSRNLPAGGLRVGGGKYSWASADGPGVSHLSPAQRSAAAAKRRNISSAQRLAIILLEARNPNWTYSLDANAIEFTYIPVSVQCMYDHSQFVTTDGRFNFSNFYIFLGLPPHQADYIPGVEVWLYRSPQQMIEELRRIPGCITQ